MDWKQAIEEDRAMLMRIVALILSLADLADGSAKRPRIICALICWILRPIEKLLAEHLCVFDDAPLPIMRYADVRVDAICLALRLRALAHEMEQEALLILPLLGPESGAVRPLQDGLGWMS